MPHGQKGGVGMQVKDLSCVSFFLGNLAKVLAVISEMEKSFLCMTKEFG